MIFFLLVYLRCFASSSRCHRYRLVIIIEPAHEILVLNTFPRNEGSGEPVQKHRIASAFAARIHNVWM